MDIEELIRRIRMKDNPERAERIIELIDEQGFIYANYIAYSYDDIHMKYDKVMEYDRQGIVVGGSVLLVKKYGMYGLIDKFGNEIVPCKFSKSYDVYCVWKKLKFPVESSTKTKKQLAIQELKYGLKSKYDELVASGDINPITFFKQRAVNGAELVKMSDGSTGIAASVMVYDSERGKNVEIKNADEEHVMFLSEPELLRGLGTPATVICSDENNLYVATYNCSSSYIACYRMVDFERVWKTSMHGSQIQSIAVQDDEVIAFDMEDGKFKYFDKHSGKYIAEKKAENDYRPGHSHHDSNELFSQDILGFEEGILDFENDLRFLDASVSRLIVKRDNISVFLKMFFGKLSSLAIDHQNKRAFVALDNKVAVFDPNGYEGYLLVPTKRVFGLNFDQETGCLLISMDGKAEVYSPEAITTLLQTTKELREKIESGTDKVSSESVDSSEKTIGQYKRA